MVSSSFHPFYTARTLEAISAGERFVPVYASSNSKIYPFQIAAANYALRSPYQKGAVLCDEAGLGKSHEAMLVITQKWLEGQQRILLVVTNALSAVYQEGNQLSAPVRFCSFSPNR